ncbi:tyrosine-type recombinase/integrase [Paracoccus salsus]|uniref:tyrosine-type recombinase/integrase n=1 Tax=Paracoccus salsus TaxID=2911061 RepID=UPI001F52AEC3|nr:tyrosine-type recombinase/integrase [Paracoccus salsus]
MPLPQDVGDAIAAYLACRPSTCRSDHVFLRNIAPFRPFRSGDGVSSVVRRLMQRAGIVAPVKGAHVLRHTAATEMLRHGVPLEKIGLVLRHRGIDTTAHYAKVAYLLKQHAATAARAHPGLSKKRISPHVLRHTCAMIILQATQDIRKVSLWLGHATLTTTEIYTRGDPTEKIDAMESIVPPHLRRGAFQPSDRLIALLKPPS